MSGSEAGEIAREKHRCHQITNDGGHEYADEARHHETVVQQVLAYHCCSRAVEVHRGDVGRIVRDEEIAINAGQHP